MEKRQATQKKKEKNCQKVKQKINKKMQQSQAHRKTAAKQKEQARKISTIANTWTNGEYKKSTVTA